MDVSEATLLVISDDVEMVEGLRAYFTPKGYVLEHASDIDEFVKEHVSQSLDMIVLETHLQSDAPRLRENVRKALKSPYIPIITIVTEREMPPHKIGLEYPPYEDIITKPFDVEELNLRVQSTIKASRRSLAQRPDLNKWRVFLISSDAPFKQELLHYFTPQDFRVEIATQTEEVIPKLLTFGRPDVIVFDVASFEDVVDTLCWEIRRRAAFAHIPMIFLAEKENLIEKIRNLVILDDSYLPKPFTLQDLERAIKRYNKSW